MFINVLHEQSATVGQAMTPGQVRDQMRARPGFASKTLGITQLTCGILSVVFGIAVIFAPYIRNMSPSVVGCPIWCGAMVSIIPFDLHNLVF